MNTPAPVSPSVDALPCGVLVLDDEGRILYLNAWLARLLGLWPEQVLGQSMAALFSRATNLLVHTYVLPLIKMSGAAEEVSVTLRHAGGQQVEALLSAHRQVDEAGVARVHCVVLHQPQRRQLQRQLLTAKRAADEAPGLLFQLLRPVRGPTAFAYVTDVIRVLFDVSPAMALASPEHVWQRIHPDDVGQVQATLASSADTLQAWRCEFRVRLDGGEGWRELHATPLREPDGTLLWNGYIADVSERKALEASLRDKAAAERANRAKSEFLARMSHELRTPLNGILGFAHMLQIQGAANLRTEQHTRLGYIEAAGHTLLRLVNELLEISRIESGHMAIHLACVDLAPVLRGALSLAEPMAAQREVRLRCAGPGQLAVHADAHRLGQVLLNLLSNAIKYGPAQGTVAIELSERADQVCIAVQDQGPGMDPAQQAQLFQPFNRLGAEQTATEGVGLGLAISQGLVQLMGGQLTVDSTPGQGCRFSVCLPRVSASVPLVQQAHSGPALQAVAPGPTPIQLAPQAAHAPPRRILYVEDNPINAVLMQALFEDTDRYVLDVVDSGAKALLAVQQAPPDALLLDMHLPDYDGPALLATLRETGVLQRVPAIAVSADAMPDDIDRALSAGFADYWTKPLDVARILPTLSALLARRPPSGGTMSV